MKKYFLFVSFTVFQLFLFSQSKSLDFVLNKGQWDNSVQFKANVIGGEIYFQNNYITYNLYDVNKLNALAHHHHDKEDSHDDSKELIDAFSYRVYFKGGNKINIEGKEQKPGYHNYILGSESKKWASNVPFYKGGYSKNIYSNIDLKVYSSDLQFKYDLIVKPGGNVSDVILKYDGVKNLKLIDGDLHLPITFDEVIEAKPYVYQIIDGKKIEITSKYVLNKNELSFEVSNYNKNYDLIIDPVVVASTYSGSTSSIYGHTATYGENGEIYSAGGGFSPGGLPVTVGAYQVIYGGSRDMCINKYNSTGSTLIYATYLGGTDADLPHSLIEYNSKLYILGSSFSTDFPVSTTAYDQTLNGMTDIVITILDPTGGSLIGSTFIGGSADDGINSYFGVSNYGDRFRGEIVTDEMGSCYIASFTESTNFPTSTGAFQSANGGNQDGVAIKLDSTLSNLGFSTYFGGTNDDGAFGIKTDGKKTYVCGTAGSSFFTNTGVGSFTGSSDAFIIALDSSATTQLHSTYFGSSSDDIAYFIEKSISDEIFILGQTNGTINATAGNYNGGNDIFITKFNNNLSAIDFVSTTTCASPVAFLVDNCDFIYASFSSANTTQALTTDAVQTTQGGFYLMTLDANGTNLLFGSYYGAPSSHVDGGTSRFDKKGVVYQATCTSSGFPTLPSAYATTNSGGYDVTVFKIDFQQVSGGITFANFKDDEEVEFDGNGCFDFVANGNSPSDSIRIDVTSNAFQYGAFVTLPIANSSGKYDFRFLDNSTGALVNENDVSVVQNDKRFSGVSRVGLRFCWEINDCDVFIEDSFLIKLEAIGINCDNVMDTTTKNITFKIKNKTNSSVTPNVFSPNGDGVNDYFKLRTQTTNKCYDHVTVRIYNRWGQLVFESDDPLFEWDGKSNKGKDLSAGSYFVVLQGLFAQKNITENFPVTLFR